MRVLIIEDDPQIAGLVADSISRAGHDATVCHHGAAGLARAQSESFDAIVLDLMLPGLEGTALLRHLRSAGDRVPVLVLTARDTTADVIEVLDLGADDYLAKPFVAAELLARLRALHRRHSAKPAELIHIADLTVNPYTREVRRAGVRIELTGREYTLLECLLRAEGETVTRTELLQQVWSFQFDPGTNVVDVAIRRLRSKIDQGRAPPLIQTVRGLGYALATAS